jgi:LEA14-like dessication related protein
MTKKLISTAIPFLLFGCCFATPIKKDIIRRELKSEMPFTSLVVEADVDVLLTEGNSTKVVIEGESASAAAVKITVENGEMTITDKKSCRHQRTVVYLPVRNLRTIVINGDVNISSSNTLHTMRMQLMVNGNCEVNLRVRGTVDVSYSDDYLIQYMKNEKIRIIKES